MRVLMVGPDPAMKGGIASVVEAYLRSDYVDRVALRYHASTVDGGKLEKAIKTVRALATFPAVALAFRPDVVHIHHASKLSFYRKAAYLLMCKGLRLRTVVHSHSGTFPAFRDASPVNALCVRWFLDASDACIALSATWKEVLAGYCSHRRIHVVPNPVDLSPFSPGPAPPQEGGDGAEKVVLTMGRLGPAKGTYDLIEAIPHILEGVPEARFVLAGDGATGDVARRIEAKGLAGIVRTPGWVSGEAKVRCLSSCDVYVLPSYFEGMPMSILEAMAAGKPVVASRVGGIPELIDDGVNGYVVPPGDVRALADRVGALLRDPVLRRDMGRRSRARVEEAFSTAVVVDALLSVYDHVRRERPEERSTRRA